MNNLIIPSLLPEEERREWERKQQRKRPWIQPPPEISLIKKQPQFIPKKILRLPIKETILKIESDADLVWNGGCQNSLHLLEINEADGISEQMSGPLGRDRELVLGLDFGTSSVKVIVGDKGASKAYAVPFMNAIGINAYLLPSRLFEQDGIFSLSKGENVHRDLKLSFLANQKSNSLQETLVGFLALIIRRCRAWLFSAHADILAGRNIVWKLVLGRAVDRMKEDQAGYLMNQMIHAAWVVAGRSVVIDRFLCRQELSRQKNSIQVMGINSPEISVVPELAAQIYGFVNSRQFDHKAKNFYLIIDIGAGTVDVSLFRVKANEDGTWNFSIFASIVAPHGVMNLHRARLDWWHQKLSKLSDAHSNTLLSKINGIKLPTEQTQSIPETYDGYFKGLKARYSGTELDPDKTFFRENFLSQVQGRGIHRTVQSKMVGRVDLDHLPFFLCGGGARLSLYKNIESELNQNSGQFSWLKAHRKELGIPSELDAPGLAQIDYDRLSVAFGLSFVDVGAVAIAEAMMPIHKSQKDDWMQHYTSKDSC